MKTCQHCNTENPDTSMFCGSCGNKFAQQQQSVDPIYTIEKKPSNTQAPISFFNKNSNAIGITIGIVLLLSICVCVGGALFPSTKKETAAGPVKQSPIVAVKTKTIPAPTEAPSPTTTPEPTKILDSRAAFQVAVKSALRESNREVDRITSIEFDYLKPVAILFKWTINDNLTEDMIKLGAKYDVAEILKVVSKSGIDYSAIKLLGSFQMVDKFGKSSENIVVNLTFKKETVDRIIWESFLTKNIYDVADAKVIHSEFQD